MRTKAGEGRRTKGAAKQLDTVLLDTDDLAGELLALGGGLNVGHAARGPHDGLGEVEDTAFLGTLLNEPVDDFSRELLSAAEGEVVHVGGEEAASSPLLSILRISLMRASSAREQRRGPRPQP